MILYICPYKQHGINLTTIMRNAGNDTKIQGKIIMELLTKFPRASSLCIAKLAYENNPLLFNSVESARCAVRYYRGAIGDGNRKYLEAYGRDFKRLNLDPGEEPEYTPYILPSENNSILFMCDMHLPFHDLNSISIALNDAKDKGVNTVILGGDILDMFQLSMFDKNPTKSGFLKEREMFWQLMDDIYETLPNSKVIFIEGNHEYRFYRYMLNNAVKVFDVDDFQMASVFRMRELGIEYISKKRYVIAGDLNIMHGHEYTGGSLFSPVNPARGMYLKAKDNVLFGHLHRTSEHTEQHHRGNVKTCYSVGCLCYLHPEYRPLNRWNSGFAIISIYKDGSFNVKNKKILNNTIQ